MSENIETKKLNVATIWLDGCSGCHMSFLDMDERIVELAQHMNIVYSPYVDAKEVPTDIDLFIVEGALSTDHDLEIIQTIRKNSKKILALGDCAITGNVSSLKNLAGTNAALERGYFDLADFNKGKYPDKIVPKLLEKVIPLNEAIDVDYFVPGCPTPADAIYAVLRGLIDGVEVDVSKYTRFGL